ncbi:MAG: hypothetical protein A2107_02610 [Verrucomicrobia bacterium GWF2_62_7]|nr:MAG: hypothetical protein A2107_02610 [Verrucomicrobia bacterium GWF2_62_7]
MSTAQLVLDYLKVLLSTQVVAGVACLAFLWMFREDIKALLLRTAKIKFPGGAEVLTSQAAKQEEKAGESDKLPSPPKDEVKLPVTLQPDDMKKVVELFQAERARAYLWEYRYLNYFLAYRTQKVLDWLASLSSRTSCDLYDAFWLPHIPSAEERKAIIVALQAHYLIIIQNNLVEVTPKGREYIQWRRPLPENKT